LEFMINKLRVNLISSVVAIATTSLVAWACWSGYGLGINDIIRHGFFGGFTFVFMFSATVGLPIYSALNYILSPRHIPQASGSTDVPF
ncbi:MAG: hypothetical protein KBB19_00005, partial [Giesbergeria sp.]|nr:hypothetical protein [Giesbergeria sp.]MBP7082118.1 hypothetical protein [Giesbergeria sp.]